jgi:hypothetical protein
MPSARKITVRAPDLLKPKDPNLLVLGFPSAAFQSAGLLSDVNLFEYPAALWHVSSLHNELVTGSDGVRLGCLERLSERLDELMAWVRAGHKLIILFTPIRPITYRAGPLDANVFDLAEIAPFNLISLTATAGHRVEYCGPDSAAVAAAVFDDRLSYEAVLSGRNLKPLFRVRSAQRGREQIVAGYVDLGAGRIVFLPECGLGDTAIEPDDYRQQCARLAAAIRESNAQSPDWLSEYMTRAEAQAGQAIDELESKIRLARAQIDAQQIILDEAAGLKQLIVGTGESFTRAVTRALEELGFKVIPGPPSRADLLAEHGGRLLVIEAKGLDGPAREKNLRQAERWLADMRSALASSPDEEQNDVDISRYRAAAEELGLTLTDDVRPDCYGAMVIGTFRRDPLTERIGASFPDPVARVVARSEIRALSGLDLLALVLEAREHPARIPEAVEKLFSTAGCVLDFGCPWPNFLIVSAALKDRIVNAES